MTEHDESKKGVPPRPQKADVSSLGPSATPDPSDGLVVLGLIFLAIALGLAWGWVAVLAYAGTVLTIVGLAMAYRRGASPRG